MSVNGLTAIPNGLLLSLELNHRLLDGVHVGRFYEALNRWMEGL